MLGAQRYPFEHAPYNTTAKTRSMQYAAEQMNRNGRKVEWQLPLLAVSFANPGDTPVPGEPIREAHRNLHDRTRYTCRLCGECDVGCNYGAKNSLDYNYLSAAQRSGAELRTLCEVRSFAPRHGGGYTVRYVRHSLEHEDRKFDTSTLEVHEATADRLILSAGTVGSTFLLLRNRTAFPALSNRLGTRFCGNGDLLTFAFKCRDSSNGTRVSRRMDPTFGPVITSAIRAGDSLDGDGSQGRGFYIEDAGFPAFLSWLLEASNVPGFTRRFLHFAIARIRMALSDQYDADMSSELSALLGDCKLTSDSLPLLGMGRDIPDGNMRLKGQWLDVDWNLRSSKAYFTRMRDTMKEMVHLWGGRFQDNLIWHLNRVITVHPLGGCPMGRTADEGVVDSFGEVFGHPGFFIVDGSIMPGPVGPNPCLTIAALADRSADRMIEGTRAP
jgi:cholesterol oxidase